MVTFWCRYDPETDGRVLLGNVDCTEEAELCRRYYGVYIFVNIIVVLVYMKLGDLF